MAGPAFSRLVEDFLESDISFENYALLCQPEPAKTSNGGGDSAYALYATSPAIAGGVSVTQKMEKALESIRLKDPYALAQFWAPGKAAGSECLLRTSNQPYGFTDLCPELCSYRKTSCEEKSSVNLESKEGAGLIGSVFLKGSPECTANVRNCSSKKYPQNVRGCLAMPVFEDGGRRCIGVVEIIMSIAKESYDWEFIECCRALQGVNLKSSPVLFCPTKRVTRQQSKPNGKAGVVGLGPKRTPKTKTSGITYEDLSRLFNKPRRIAAAELKICRSTLRNVCRLLGIKTWPYKKRARGSGMQQANTEVLELTSPATVTEDNSSTITSDSEDDDGAEIMVDQPPREVVEPTSLASGYESDHGAVMTDDQYPAQDFEPTYSAIVEAAAMEHSRTILREDESGVGNQSREEAFNPTFLAETNATTAMEWESWMISGVL